MLIDLKMLPKREQDDLLKRLKKANIWVVLAAGERPEDVYVYGIVTKHFLGQCVKALTEAIKEEPEEEPL